MLTADPEGFPLGLAELGLKKPKAGGENTRRRRREASPAWPRLGLADLPAEGDRPQGPSSEDEQGPSPWHLQRSLGKHTPGERPRSPLRTETDQTDVSQGLEGLDRHDCGQIRGLWT